MDVTSLLTLEIALIGLVGTGVGFLTRTVGRRFDKVDRSVSKIHNRIERLKDSGHAGACGHCRKAHPHRDRDRAQRE